MEPVRKDDAFRRPAAKDIIRCVLCDSLLPIHMVLCSRCERSACAHHFVFDPGFEWLCPGCVEVHGGDVDE